MINSNHQILFILPNASYGICLSFLLRKATDGKKLWQGPTVDHNGGATRRQWVGRLTDVVILSAWGEGVQLRRSVRRRNGRPSSYHSTWMAMASTDVKVHSLFMVLG
ncbi:hypothetical protein AB6A40_009244 [Gnathostoma spinigerum]|uniref:Uncharacterized protein n=1 Tax=Gnathostoma spinigerum TaxID=75299 RepID=A0ABD6ERD9_9BILA